jgi:hypothetical protein
MNWNFDMSQAPPATKLLVWVPTARRPEDRLQLGRYGLKADGDRLWTYGGMFAFDVGVARAWMYPPELPPQPKE